MLLLLITRSIIVNKNPSLKVAASSLRMSILVLLIESGFHRNRKLGVELSFTTGN